MGTLKRRIIEAEEPKEEPPMDVSGWIPVSERLPPDGVLVFAYGKRAEYGFRRDGQWGDTLYGGVLGNGPTHWMPMPEPPEVK